MLPFTQTNVRGLISRAVKTTKAGYGGLNYAEGVYSGIEGHFVTIKDHTEKYRIGLPEEKLKEIRWKVHIKAHSHFNEQTGEYSDPLADFAKEGYFFSIEDRRHPVTNGWTAQPEPLKTYMISFIHDGDGTGELTFYLKDKGAS